MHLINLAVMVLVEKTAEGGRTGQRSRGVQGKPLEVVIIPESSASKRLKALESQEELTTSNSQISTRTLPLRMVALRLWLPAAEVATVDS